MEYIDSMGRRWDSRETDIDDFCQKHKIDLIIEYLSNKEGVYVHTKAYFNETGETIVDRNDKYPISDEKLLGEMRKHIRNKKIDSIL
jgi:hypothetical protein